MFFFHYFLDIYSFVHNLVALHNFITFFPLFSILQLVCFVSHTWFAWKLDIWSNINTVTLEIRYNFQSLLLLCLLIACLVTFLDPIFLCSILSLFPVVCYHWCLCLVSLLINKRLFTTILNRLEPISSTFSWGALWWGASSALWCLQFCFSIHFLLVQVLKVSKKSQAEVKDLAISVLSWKCTHCLAKMHDLLETPGMSELFWSPL